MIFYILQKCLQNRFKIYILHTKWFEVSECQNRQKKNKVSFKKYYFVFIPPIFLVLKSHHPLLKSIAAWIMGFAYNLKKQCDFVGVVFFFLSKLILYNCLIYLSRNDYSWFSMLIVHSDERLDVGLLIILSILCKLNIDFKLILLPPLSQT